ncbi:plasmolipin-like [Cloeon dipterum]|uniref:plasmolipin-like n=1 Tax=Cloeon dipterum TaxID=197152 RepID=UPI00322014B1
MAGNMMCEQHPQPRGQKLSQMTLTAESVESVGVGTPTSAIPPKFGVRMDLAHFFRSNEGFLKLLQLAIGVACVACAAPALIDGTYDLPAGSYWFIAATVFSVVLTFIWVLIYLLCFKERARKFPWSLFETLLVICLAILYASAGIAQLVIWSSAPYSDVKEENIIAGSLALFNVVCHSVSLYYAMSRWCKELNAE